MAPLPTISSEVAWFLDCHRGAQRRSYLPAWLRVSTLWNDWPRLTSLKLLGKLCAVVWGKMDEKGARGGRWEEEQGGC